MSLPGPVVARPIRIAQAFVVFALLAKAWLSVMAPPIGDEAYYWLWGQRLDWSYFDHPPLHAWLLRAMSLLGWNTVALRLLTWLTLAAIGLSVYDVLGRRAYAAFMAVSAISVCYLVVIAALLTLRLRRVA